MNVSNLSGISIPNSSPDKTIVTQDIEARLAAIDNAQAKLNQTDTAILESDMQPASAETLAMIAAQQKQVVVTMVSGNPEQAIAIALAQSIEAYSARLEAIDQQTKGLGAFSDAMEIMWKDISQTSPLTGTALEDAFQLVLMDVLIHSEDYPSLTSDDFETIQRFLECSGSGMHGSHEGYDQDEFARDVTSLFNKIYLNAPEGSLARSIVDSLDADSNCPQALVEQFNNGWGNLDGWKYDWENGVGDVSPILRMAILSSLLGDPSIELSSEEYNMILTGSLSDIDGYMQVHFQMNTIGYINSDHLQGWNFHWEENESTGTGYGMNFWSSEGVTFDYFEDLAEQLPSRPLTDEEIEEINRIGDQVKMLQQTLKYWLSICRDEQMAIARNI
ncbi:hypothetical protein [Vibrio splendidus]|uniref:Uncharacterized protein n=1 Tax=Vibrio splendidus 12E03 TaxID=1191305 RepID=A0A1E5FTI3_VIBSP|nr:hypothetical protein [Vibrio splendidus]OEF93827.1 hypothetical protein A142_19545 [Vibrio splendidus 12E03]